MNTPRGNELWARDETEAPAGMNWKTWHKDKVAWVGAKCATASEMRTVPCISLEVVIAEWLRGHNVTHIKIDAQGSDLNGVRSAGRMVSVLKSVVFEVRCDLAPKLYEGDPNCSYVHAEMVGLGFKTDFPVSQCLRCIEINLKFHRE